MSHLPPLVPDDARLKAFVAKARQEGPVISRQTAHELASWFAEGIGPGFATFRSTGIVTHQLYAELVRLHDLRSDEGGQWLANLTRFVLAQPAMSTRRRSSGGRRSA